MVREPHEIFRESIASRVTSRVKVASSSEEKADATPSDVKKAYITKWNTTTMIFPVLHASGVIVIGFVQHLRSAWHLVMALSEGSLLSGALGRLFHSLICLAISALGIYALMFEVANKENKAMVKSRTLFFPLLHLLRALGISMTSFQPLRSPADEACGIPNIDIIQMVTFYQVTDLFGLAPSGLMMKINMLELPWHMWLDYRYASLNLIDGSNTIMPYLKTRGLRLTGVRFLASILPVMLDSSSTYRQECQLVIFLLSGALLFKTFLQIGIQFSYGKMNGSSWDIILPILAMFCCMSADYGSMLKLAHHKLEDMKAVVSQTFQRKSEQDIIQEVKDIASLVNAAGAPEEGGGGDKLELLESIGGGAHGTVFKGRWKGMEVAVKTVMFPFEYGSDKGSARQRAVLEAGVSCSVVHPNIVTTYHWDIKGVQTMISNKSSASTPDSSKPSSISLDPSLEARDWKLFLVQELCQASLHTVQDAGLFFIQQGPRKGQPLLVSLLGALLDISKGLEYLHSKGIIHGDLKPENILAKTDPSKPHGFTCKITDFGLSAMMDPKKTHVSNFRHGTPFYMAPEIFSGQSTPAADVFSFGILMTELYTGLQPWLFQEGRFKPNLTFFDKLDKEAPTPFKKLANSCVAMEPKERPNFAEITVSIQEMFDEESSEQEQADEAATK